MDAFVQERLGEWGLIEWAESFKGKDIGEVLRGRQDGKAIEKEMDEGLLSHKMRLKAVRIFVSHLMEKFGDRPTARVKEALARSIVDEFPKLKGEVGNGYEAWYTCSIGKHAATGYLEEKPRNVRKRSLDKLPQDMQKRRQVKQHDPAGPQNPADLSVSLESTEDDLDPAAVEAMTQWLPHNKEPANKVKDYHKQTQRTRLLWMREHPKGEVFEKYPRLLDTPGLMNMDFEAVQPNCGDNLFLLWTPVLSRKFLQYADKQRDWPRHLGISADHRELSDDEVCNIAFQCLPCILPVGSKKGNSKSQRATIARAVTSFVDVQSVGVNIPRYLENLRTHFEVPKEECIQPFILAVGDRKKPEQVFVILEGEAIPQE